MLLKYVFSILDSIPPVQKDYILSLVEECCQNPIASGVSPSACCIYAYQQNGTLISDIAFHRIHNKNYRSLFQINALIISNCNGENIVRQMWFQLQCILLSYSNRKTYAVFTQEQLTGYYTHETYKYVSRQRLLRSKAA